MDFFRDFYAILKIEQLKIIYYLARKRKKAARFPSPKIEQEKVTKSQDFLLQAIQNTSTSSDGSILASELGIVMSQMEPLR